MRIFQTLLGCGYVLAAVVAPGCHPKTTATDAPQTEPVLRVGLGSWIGYAPLFYAQEKGLDRKNGFKMDLVRITDNQVRRDALLAGKLDVNITTVDMAAVTATINPKLRLFFVTDISTGGDGIIAKKSIGTIADLKGRKVAVNEGTPSHFLLLYAMSKSGLSHTDIEIVPARADETPELLKLGSVDAIVTWEPWLSKAEQYGFHVILSTKDHTDLIVDALETLEATMQQKSTLLHSLCQTWEDALQFCSSPEAITAMAKVYEKDAKVFESMLPEMHWLDIRENKDWFRSPPSKVEALLAEAHHLYKATGKIDKDIPILEIVDESVVRSLKDNQ